MPCANRDSLLFLVYSSMLFVHTSGLVRWCVHLAVLHFTTIKIENECNASDCHLELALVNLTSV